MKSFNWTNFSFCYDFILVSKKTRLSHELKVSQIANNSEEFDISDTC